MATEASRSCPVPLLYNNLVPRSRTILIHNGNYPGDTEGCLLAGKGRIKDMVTSSVSKLREIKKHLNDFGISGAKIIITEDY